MTTTQSTVPDEVPLVLESSPELIIHVAYPRPIPAGTTVRFEGRILHRGRAFAVTQVTALNESGMPCVIATVTTGAAA